MASEDVPVKDQNVFTMSATRVVKKRNRLPLSCEACRLRKLKCNRQRPCQNCIARAASDSCSYAAQTSNGVLAKAHPTGTEDVYSRVNRLESLVLSLIPKAPTLDNVSSASGSTAATFRPGPGDQNIHISEEATTAVCAPFSSDVGSIVDGRQYIGESHWDVVLRDIAAVKQYLEIDRKIQERLPALVEFETPALLAGMPISMNVSEILSSLPSKTIVDQLVSHFFQTYDPALPSVRMASYPPTCEYYANKGSVVLHKPTFLKQYNNYWNDMSKAPLIWVGLLYSVICLALQSYFRDGGEPLLFRGITASDTDTYRTRAAQCILASGISIPSPNSIETLMLYGLCEYSRLSNGNVGFWMLWGLVVRKAVHMGYHTDPKSSPSISPFDGEIRRRLWMCVVQMDLLLSFQLGLPTMIRTNEYNAEAPRYLHDEELYEDMEELPPSRSPSEPTRISYLITKNHLLQGFAKVIQYLHDGSEHSYNRVLELNDELILARSRIPLQLRLQDEPQPEIIPRSTALERMQLQMLYHKAICVLNRRYLSVKTGLPIYKRARWLCLQSAMSLLSIQTTMHKDGIRWYRFSLSSHDFLLAAVIVCLVLYNFRESRGNLDATSGTIEGFTTTELLVALVNSKSIWDDILESSSDARRAARVLGIMLEKFNTPAAREVIEEARPRNIEAVLPAPTRAFQAATLQMNAEMTGLETTSSVFDWETWDSIVQGAEFESLDGLWNPQEG
ncbi:hypothetical protein MMC11_008142 [Xylographa trunciseda]|nr:hypothetical protein [Xylographa trunciseda]